MLSEIASDLRFRVRALFRRRDVERELDDELAFHLEHETAKYERMGVPHHEAVRRARLAFGGVDRAKEESRDARGLTLFETSLQDIRYALRGLRANPGFTLAVALTLALGIGANASIFAVLDRMFGPLPGVSDPDRVHRLHVIYHLSGRTDIQPRFGYPEFRELRAVLPKAVALAAYYDYTAHIARPGIVPTGGVAIVGDYFGLLGVRPALGRLFSDDEARVENRAPVAVISHRMWTRDFFRDPKILGQQLLVDSVAFTIIGVAPDAFHGTDMSAADVWIPWGGSAGRSNRVFYEQARGHLTVLMRTPPGLNPRPFAAAAGPILGRGRTTHDSTAIGVLGDLRQAVSDRDRLGASVGIPAQIAAIAIIILLIACANVANLLLARGLRRRREFAIRLVLGVSRWRLIRQLFAETLLLSIIAGAMALLLGAWGTAAMRAGLFPGIRWPDAPLNTRLVALTIVLAVLASFGAGLSPVLQGTRLDLTSSLKGTSGEGRFQRSRLRTGLLLLQTALSVVLLAGAGAFVRSLYNVQHVNTGYDIDRLVTTSVELLIPHDTDRFDNYALNGVKVNLPELIERLRRLPGVENVGMATAPPMLGGFIPAVFVPEFDSLPKVGSAAPGYVYVSPDYMSTVGIRVQSGRGITDDDRSGNEPVAVVNATMANTLWPTESAIGKCVRLEKRESACRTIVGVASDQNDWGLVEEHSMHVFAPLAQARRTFRFSMLIVMRTTPERVPALTKQARRAMAELLAPGRTARAEPAAAGRIPAALRPWRLSATIFAAAGLLALLVASIGVYSVIAYTFGQRTHEIGIRIALGAGAASVGRLVVGEGVRIVVGGVCIGAAIALALGKIVASALYGTSPRDPAVLVGAALTLTIVAVIACVVPAWRAMRIDPIQALRSE